MITTKKAPARRPSDKGQSVPIRHTTITSIIAYPRPRRKRRPTAKTWIILGRIVLAAAVVTLFGLAVALGIDREQARQEIERIEWEAFINVQ